MRVSFRWGVAEVHGRVLPEPRRAQGQDGAGYRHVRPLLDAGEPQQHRDIRPCHWRWTCWAVYTDPRDAGLQRGKSDRVPFQLVKQNPKMAT